MQCSFSTIACDLFGMKIPTGPISHSCNHELIRHFFYESPQAEQQWQPLVRLTRSLNFMSGTHFKFWLHSYYTLSNVWRQRTAARTLQREDKKNSQIKRSVRWTADGRPFRKKDKHAFRSHALKSRSKKRGRKGKKRAQVVVSKSRVPITSAMKKASPLGFDQRLLMKESGRFKYTHIPHGLFKD